VKELKWTVIRQYDKSNDLRGLTQALTTFAGLALLWWAVSAAARVSGWLLVPVVILLSLFSLRVFALMHECGHGSLFRSQRLNRAFGFAFGVAAGMPQYVWAQHHDYHHNHNGNWEKYRGPYTTLSVEEYAALSPRQQRLYRWKCSIALSPVAGFIYLIFNPRFTWMTGGIGLIAHVVRQKLAHPAVSLRSHAATFKTRYWNSARELRHMTWNNLALLSSWALMSWAIGPWLFFTVYLISLSFAGAAGIVLFTVQHNFRHSYASATDQWDRDVGAINGTSFLILPGWLNWFTANIGYHHVHHLSAQIPNYRLIQCHDAYQDLFGQVTRLKLADVPGSLMYILWDIRARQLISVAEYREQLIGAHALA
jgi:omega-6 fatty acid desaturase (delta-12 desaturase)